MESVTPWPPIGWEARTWVPSVPSDLVSRRVRERHRGPYDSAVVPRIAAQQVHLPSAILAIADEASIEIARFDAESGARLAPFGAILLRSESTSSSRIENLTSGAKAIALAELGATDQRNAVEIVGNVHAMQTAIDLSGHLDENLVLAMHSALMSAVDSESVEPVADRAGLDRRRQLRPARSDVRPSAPRPRSRGDGRPHGLHPPR